MNEVIKLANLSINSIDIKDLAELIEGNSLSHSQVVGSMRVTVFYLEGVQHVVVDDASGQALIINPV